MPTYTINFWRWKVNACTHSEHILAMHQIKSGRGAPHHAPAPALPRTYHVQENNNFLHIWSKGTTSKWHEVNQLFLWFFFFFIYLYIHFSGSLYITTTICCTSREAAWRQASSQWRMIWFWDRSKSGWGSTINYSLSKYTFPCWAGSWRLDDPTESEGILITWGGEEGKKKKNNLCSAKEGRRE